MTTRPVQSSNPVQPRPVHLGHALVPGLLVIIAAAVQGDGALITAAYRGESPVSDSQLSFPWSGTTAITTSLIWGVTQLMLVVGLGAFTRSRAVRSKAGQVGGWLAVAGALLYVVAHGLTLMAPDSALDDSIAVAAMSCFVTGTVLTAIGLIVAGVATLRSGAWSNWRRFTPLVLGIWMVAMVPLQFTAALPVAVAIYAVATIAFGVALLVDGLTHRSEI